MTHQAWLEAPYDTAARDDAAYERYLQLCSNRALVAREIVRRLPDAFDLPEFQNAMELGTHLVEYLKGESRDWVNAAGVAMDLWPTYERWLAALNQPDPDRASDE